jgi:hypothetical protein
MRFIVRTILFLLCSTLFLTQFAPASAGEPPCTTRPDNMTRNGSITDGGYPTQYGVVANEWNPFILGGSPPAYALADNESANGDIPGSSSQYIHGDGIEFDAGIYQTINGTVPGAYYQFSVGWAAMLRDIGQGQNKKMDNVIVRLVAADPTGGTDPHSASVIWGPEFSTGSSSRSLNSPQMSLVFPAQADHVTVFIRAFDRSAAASDKVFLDVICMVPRPDLPTATPAATATATPAPTDTPRPTRLPSTAVPATKVPTPTETSVPTLAYTPTNTNTPKPSSTPTETPKPHRPIPAASPAAASGPLNAIPVALFFGSVGVVLMSAAGIFGLIGFILLHLSRQRNLRIRGGPALTYPQFYGDEMDEFNQAVEPGLPPDEQLPGDIF